MGVMELLARYRTKEPREQSLLSHLLGTAELAFYFGQGFNFGKLEQLAALLHDVGKATESWQRYLKSSVEGKKMPKKDHDHATAGAKLLEKIDGRKKSLALTAIQACVMYHHGAGLPDMISLDGNSEFLKRLNKNIEDELKEIEANLSQSVKEGIENCLQSEGWKNDGRLELLEICRTGCPSPKKVFFNMGLHLRNLSSCLIDADRTDSALFERDEMFSIRQKKTDWDLLLKRLEHKLDSFSNEGELGKIRKDVSSRCAELGLGNKGIYTCSAFTGAGKTLASLRFALEQAKKFNMERIFIIAPYTSIIDQNADCIRNILETENERGKIVIECHSNLSEEKKSDFYSSSTEYEDAIETWNSPVIITTMVQFLETLFAGGTKKIRRMHNLANSVLVFDEIQTLPIKSTYLFNWGLDYLVKCCGCSALLCTATQPCLDKIGEEKFHLQFDGEVVENLAEHFSSLKRTEFIDKTDGGIKKVSVQNVCDYIQQQMESCRSFLAVANTKPQAKELFELVKQISCAEFAYHLSTNMCPAHRRKKIDEIRNHLAAGDRIVCVSTRLIEAGVDLSFEGALRYMAGLDSVIQTAGRCNRNNNMTDETGKPICGKVAIFSLEDEKLGSLDELRIGQECMERVLCEIRADSEECILIQPEIITRFFTYYYAGFSSSLLEYSVNNKDSTVLDMLSDNQNAVREYVRTHGGDTWKLPYMQSFKTAWENFEVISDVTTGVIVPYKNDIAGRLCALERGEEDYGEKMRFLLREAQQYSVNVYSNQLERLMKEKMIYEVLPDSGIYALFDEFYDDDFGLSYGTCVSSQSGFGYIV